MVKKETKIVYAYNYKNSITILRDNHENWKYITSFESAKNLCNSELDKNDPKYIHGWHEEGKRNRLLIKLGYKIRGIVDKCKKSFGDID